MASSSVSQEDLENDFELTSRRSRIRTARARTVNPSRMESNGDTTEEAFSVAKATDTLNVGSCGQGEHDASPKPLSRSKEKRINRCVPIRQPLTDHINRTNHMNKGKQQRDRRKLREKRRSTGVVHLQSTESTGGSTGEDEDDILSTSVETKRNTQHNEHVDRDVVEDLAPPKSYHRRRNKSPSDLDADDEDNQNQSDSTVSSLVQVPEQSARARPATPTGDNPEELLERAKEENRRLLSLLEDKDYKILTLEKKLFQIQHENSLEIERLREENATLMRAMASLKSKSITEIVLAPEVSLIDITEIKGKYEQTLNIPRSLTNCIEKMADTGGEVNPPKKIDNREEKLRAVRERQAEERQRRLEELKKHALETQQLREQKELERKRRMEDLKQKENERRSQVEERKRQIWEAEKERREAILRKNQEREARIESKRKNERGSIVFAFGSSTPRMLETSDSNSFWGPRRATSTANLRLFPTTTLTVPLSRRPSERELEPKKRASSAGGLYRNPGDLMSTSMYEVFHWDSEPSKPRLSLAPHTDPSLSLIDDPSMQSLPRFPIQPKSFHVSHAIVGDSEDTTPANTSHLRIGRRKTDLMPTIPSPREGTNSRPASGTRSLARTPGRAYSMARLDILAQPRVVHAGHFSQPLSTPSKSMSRSTNHLVESKQFQSNTLAKTDTSKSMVQLHSKGSSLNFIQPRMTRAQRLRNRAKAVAAASSKSLSPEGGLSSGDTTPSRPGSVLSQYSATSASTPTPPPRMRSTPRRPRPFSIHVTGVSKDKEIQKINSPSEEKSKLKEIKLAKPPSVKQSVLKKQNQQKNEEISKLQSKTIESNTIVEAVKQVNGDSSTDERKIKIEESKKEISDIMKNESVSAEVSNVENQRPNEKTPSMGNVDNVDVASAEKATEQNHKKDISPENETDKVTLDDESGKTNVMSRSKITTEEEAKAALAERRRLAREQAEREAEARRLREKLEEEKEAERLRKEEEEQRLAEEEQLRLLEESRRIENDRLMQAIQEAQKRDEEEKERRQQEELARLEREESERKSREEAERQTVERLKREEEERQERRKRVEAIMKRTRNNPASSTTKADSEKGEEDRTEHEKDEPKGKVEVFLHGERLSSERSLTNGQPSQENHKETLDNNMIDNNHSNGVEITTSSLEKEDCLNSNSTLVTPLIAFQGKTKDTQITANYLA